MIDDRAITEARRRLRNKAQNEQTSVTFSELLRIAEQENKQLREENERLRENAKTISELEQLAARSNNDLLVENERLRKDAEVGSAIQRAAAELPAGYIVGISVEADAATVELCLPTGHIKSMDVDDDNRLAAEINAAIDAARGAK